MAFCYAHRSLPCSVIIREASSCLRREQIQRPSARQCAESERVWTLSPKWDVSIRFLLSEFREPHGRGGGNSLRARVWRTPRKQGPLNPHKHKSPYSSQRPRQQAQVCTRLHTMAPSWVFLWDSWTCSLIPVSSLGLSSYCWLVLSTFNTIVSVLPYYILFCYIFKKWMNENQPLG